MLHVLLAVVSWATVQIADSAVTNTYVQEGSIGTLTCNVPVNSTAQWNGPCGIYAIGTNVNTENSQKDRISVVLFDGDYKLQISNVQKIDSGFYTCDITNPIEQQYFHLRLKVQLTSVTMIPSGHVDIQISADQLFTCSARSLPAAEIKWYINSVQINETSSTMINDTKTSMFNYIGKKNDLGNTVHCNATNEDNTVRSLDAILNITYGPATNVLDPNVTSIVKNKGDRLEHVLCTADCYPSCQYQWTKDGEEVVQGDTLFIQTLKGTDQGTYTCRAWNGIGDASINLTLSVNYGPEYTNFSPNKTTYTVKENASLPVITCNADCRPTCSKYWIGPNSQITLSNTLLLHNIQRKQDGIYTCYVNNTLNSSRSTSITVNVTYGPGKSQTLVPPNTTITKIKGEDLDPVRCEADCNPICQYQWTKDGQVVLQRDTLSKQSLENTDHGTYTCRAWNGIGDASIDFMLTINYGPENTTFMPENFRYTIVEFSNISAIECTSDCRPECSIQWVGPNSMVVSSHRLLFDNVTRTQAGTYRCYVNNTVNSSWSSDIKVIVNYGASISSFEINNGTFLVQEKQSVIMTCKADGVPKPKIVWSYNGDELSYLENRTNNHFTSTCEKTGNYTCEVVNYLAKTNQTIEMFVECDPRCIPDMSTSNKIGIKNGEPLNISVSVIAYPRPTISWSFKNETISGNISHGIFRHHSYIFKPIVREDDFGNYKMFIINKVGQKSYVYSVNAERKPDPPIVISASCSQVSMRVFWNSSFDGGDKQWFVLKATDSKTKQERHSDKTANVGDNPLNTTIEDLRPGTSYYVAVVANNSHGETTSDSTVNCTTHPSDSGSTNLIAVAAGAGTGLATLVIVIVLLVIIMLRRRSVLEKTQNDKEPFQSNQNQEDENDGLKDNPIYVTSDLSQKETLTENTVNSEVLKQGEKKTQGQDGDSTSKQINKHKKGKENKAIEMGCVYENSEDFVKHVDQIYTSGNNGSNKKLEYSPQKNKDGLIYADLDFASVSERRFVIHGLENKSNYAIIDLSKKSDLLPSDEEEKDINDIDLK